MGPKNNRNQQSPLQTTAPHLCKQLYSPRKMAAIPLNTQRNTVAGIQQQVSRKIRTGDSQLKTNEKKMTKRIATLVNQTLHNHHQIVKKVKKTKCTIHHC